MEITALPPSPQTTLAVLLGASEWPYSPELPSSRAFVNAARGLRDYLLNPRRFGLPAENLLDLFNSHKSNDELDVELRQFLQQRIRAMKGEGKAARDLLVYFVGHGGFAGRDHDFYLTIWRTRMDSLIASGISMLALAEALTGEARHLRRIIILDCCFAAAAFAAFQAGPAQVALEKTIDAFEVKWKSEGFPTKGTALLCSSDHKSPSLLLPDGSSTMFTKALLDALSKEAVHSQERLSLREVKDVTADLIHEQQNAPRPVVLSPDQSEGDVADIPFFPNPRAEQERARQAEAEHLRRAEQKQIHKIEEQIAPPALASPLLTKEPQIFPQGTRALSRRQVLVGLAAVGVAGGGVIWWRVSQSSSPLLQPTPTTSQNASPVSQNSPEGTLLYTYKGHADVVAAIVWSRDDMRIASASDDVQVWNAADGSHVYTYKGHTSFVTAIAWSPDGQRIASGSKDKTVQVWNAADGSHVYTYKGNTSPVDAIAWSHDGQRIASGSEDDTVQVWNAASGQRLFTYRGHLKYGVVGAIAWSPDGQRIASGSTDATVQVWNAADGSHVYTYKGHAEGVDAIAWSPDGQRIASASSDATVQVWNAADGSHVYTYKGHTSLVAAIAWSRDGQRIASGSWDKTVQVWNAADGSHVYTYKGHTDAVDAIAWSRDGQRIASGSWDKTVQVWQEVSL